MVINACHLISWEGKGIRLESKASLGYIVDLISKRVILEKNPKEEEIAGSV